MPHPLDRCVWNALRSRQADLAIGDGRAVGFERSYAMFIAGQDRSPASLEAMSKLVPEKGQAGLVEREAWPLPPRTRLVSEALVMQMVAQEIDGSEAGFPFLDLGDDDAPDMLALARMTKPGPFFERTHGLGGFIGVRDMHGRLIAMAGERMKVDEFAEVSAVCTHPEHRGRGLAKGLIRVVASRIISRGETPFLHTYPDNAGAIALYETLGFRRRAEVNYTIIVRV